MTRQNTVRGAIHRKVYRDMRTRAIERCGQLPDDYATDSVTDDKYRVYSLSDCGLS